MNTTILMPLPRQYNHGMREKHHPTTRRLVELAKAQDQEAVEQLFEKAYPQLLQAARFRLGPALRARLDTMDLAQTAYHAAFRDLSRYQYEGKGSFSRWLLGILENKIRNSLEYFKAKRRDMRKDVSLDAGAPVPAIKWSPSDELEAAEDREHLEKAMDMLPEDHRDVIVSRYYLGMPWAEIGEQMGRSEEAAQMLCNRALAKLKKLYLKGAG